MTDRLDEIRGRLKGGIHYQHAGQWVREDIAYLLAEVTRLRDALDRLASNEAFITPRVATEEETARMQYAEQARDGIL